MNTSEYLEGSGKQTNAVDAELQDFLMMEKQKAQVNAQVSHSHVIF
jgi:hypothetical protein